MHKYKFNLTKVIDGDTIDGQIDLGFNILYKVRIRLSGIDTPETRTRNLTEKKYGIEAKNKLLELLTSDSEDIVVQSHGLGKFGRVLGTLYVGDKNINDIMISDGYAIEYHGNKKIETSKLLEMLDLVRSKK